MRPLGISTLTWASQPIDRAIGNAQALGFGSVDLGVLNDWTEFGPRDLVDRFHPLADRLERALAGAGVEALTLNAGFGTEKDPGRVQEQAAALARLARRLGVPGITLNAGPAGPLEAAVQRLAPVFEAVSDEGVGLWVETHFDSFTESISDTLALLTALPGLKLTLDASHYLIQGLTPRDWSALLPSTAHAHFRPCGTAGWATVQVEPRASSPLVAQGYRALEAWGYSGTATFELIENFNVVDAAEATRQFQKEWLS